MRVWLIDDRPGHDPEGLEAPLRQLQAHSDSGVDLLAAGPFSPERLAEVRGRMPEVIVVHGAAWPEGPWLEEVLALGAALLVATPVEQCERFRAHAERHPLWFIPPRPPASELRLALLTALAGQKRHAHWKGEVDRLNQRLNDRILIERAKGVLLKRLGITEEDAYERLRVLARRQRRPLRDIAQSVLDTQMLLLPEADTLLEHSILDEEQEQLKPPSPR